MRYGFIRGHRSEFKVEKMCQVMGVSRGAYYDWKVRPTSKRAKESEIMLVKIKVEYDLGRKVYGSPRVHANLKKKGIKCGENRVARLMKINGICAKTKKKFKATTDSEHNLPVAENLLGQNFKVDAPNKVWVSDITYIPTGEGWLYLAVVIDLFNRQVVGWAMNERMKKELAMEAFAQAILQRGPGPGLIHHTDRGSQYASEAFQGMVAHHRARSSMSGKGNCYDNACAETFFKTLKTELVYFNKYQTRSEAKESIFEYIEVFYNRERKHSTLGYRSPVEFERLRLVA